MVEDDRDKTREQLVDELRALRAETADLRKRIVSLEDVIEVIDDAVFVKDGLGRYLMINTAGALTAIFACMAHLYAQPKFARRASDSPSAHEP